MRNLVEVDARDGVKLVNSDSNDNRVPERPQILTLVLFLMTGLPLGFFNVLAAREQDEA